MIPVSIPSYPPIPPAGEGPYPLTFQQERVLHFCRLEPDSSIWDINTCKRLIGTFDARALRRSVELVIERHQALRTRLSDSAGGATQSFDLRGVGALREIDISCQAQNGVERAIAACLTEICQKPISRWIFEERLFEVVLLWLAPQDHVLLLRVHHIIADAASIDVLWRDLTAIYNGLVGDAADRFTSVRLDYSDYAVWQRRQFAPERTLEQEAYWLDQFRDEPPALDLPTDAPPSAIVSFKGGLEILEIAKDLIDDFQRIGWERRVILFSSLFAAYLVLLHKICQQDDITTGVLFSGRHYAADLNEAVGFFVNTTAVRVEVRRDCTFDQLVQVVHAQVETAYCMQDYPFERLVQRLAPRRGEGRVPLVRTMFNVVRSGDDETLFAGLSEARWIDVATQTNAVQVDMIFDLHWGTKGAEIRIEYNTDLFRKETVVRLAGYYITLLRLLRGGWNVPVAELDLVDEAERRQLVEGWNPPPTPYAATKCVHELFEAQVVRKGDSLAVVHGERALTYAQLNAEANCLAKALRERGIGPDSIVAILGGRSAGMVIGLLAILKAGGAYLPIARNSPGRRVQQILDDAVPRALILTDDDEPALDFSGPVFRLGKTGAVGAPEPDNASGTEPTNLAYVIYTSGSTGTPKGVMVEHASVVNLATNMDYMRLVADDRILQTGAPSFDATTFEIWGALLNGLRLYLADDDVLLDAARLGAFLAENRITVMFCVPTLFNHLVEADASVFRQLRYVLSGGDVLSLKHVELARQVNPRLTVINAYGPTENTTFSTCYPIIRRELRTVPIGKPIPNSCAHVFDREMMLSPVGAIGELFVGGVGLARGYLNCPALTAERFVGNPFVPGERLYRTGDLVRRRSDGMLEFIGRADRQVKIRGFRTEPGEIENRLFEVPGVREVVVLPVTGEDGKKQLCAYFAADAAVGAATLRTHLATVLPGYMVPASFCRVERMPLTESGKIDQWALPLPEAGCEIKDRVPVRGAEEIGIARIWCELLGRAEVSANDNFFELGGHSLQASALACRLTAEFGVPVSLRMVFDAPTVEELALAIVSCKPGEVFHATVC
ncbi:hypothetical protein CQ12_30420 [Bradyrhizobium jicamae]|uniref:Carrier domain-containing protein n=1 Tax=Bradyrhizobium jicamae TaxID=280332 RepID=A0A0R3KIG1_9BRAD|nr:non-ribosomal peptide synthetase [Bradyrhizobium jicamae]KRQ92932.1 hypothetical protein CQ12_30420 [Bradyrhizobium jicamae]